IDAEGTAVEPLQLFRGTLDGQGHEIRNLTIGSEEDLGSKALIVENFGEITRLGVRDAESHRGGGPYAGGERVGVLAVANRGSITESYVVDSAVSGGWRSALIAAENYGTVADSYATGEVRGNWESAGAVAWNAAGATLTRSYADATVHADVQNAGIVTSYGYTDTELTSLVARGDEVTMTNSSPIGRIGARDNDSPTYRDNLALESITLNGQPVTCSATDANGQDATEQQLAEQGT